MIISEQIQEIQPAIPCMFGRYLLLQKNTFYNKVSQMPICRLFGYLSLEIEHTSIVASFSLYVIEWYGYWDLFLLCLLLLFTKNINDMEANFTSFYNEYSDRF